MSIIDRRVTYLKMLLKDAKYISRGRSGLRNLWSPYPRRGVIKYMNIYCHLPALDFVKNAPSPRASYIMLVARFTSGDVLTSDLT
jgi:hypothetical protein